MEWRKSIVRKYKSDVRYMAVAEYGVKNNRIHWHVLLKFNDNIKFDQAKCNKGKLLFFMNRKGRNVLDSKGKSVPNLIIPNWEYGITDFYPIYNKIERDINYIAQYITAGEGSLPYEEQGDNSKSYLASKGLNIFKRVLEHE